MSDDIIDLTGYEPNAELMSDAQVVSTRDSPFGVARVFQIATPHQTPVSTPRGNLVSSLGAEFLRGVL
eukprot:6492615-Amphidinium_carterae.1